MEKIYMRDEEINKKRGKLSIISSVVISFVAIFALVIVGFNQISFAIPDVGVTLGDSFVSYWDGQNHAIGSNSSFRVPKLETTNGDVVFCLEKDIDYKLNLTYTKNSIINDAGLLYLMANLYPNKTFKDGDTELNELAQIWLSQSAIWIYVAESHALAATNDNLPKYPNNTYMTSEVIDKIKNEVSLYNSSGDLYVLSEQDKANGITTLYKKFGIDDYLTEAARIRGQAANTFKAHCNSQNISLSQDGKYYLTDYFYAVSHVYASSIGTFNGYSVSVANAPSGTMIVDMSGNEIKDTSNLSSDSKFRLKIPVDNVNNDNKNIALSFIGSFDTYAANKYTSPDSQTVTSVKKINNNLSDSYNIEANYSPRVPDTALDNSSTFFFVGIILLLSGLGVFYTSVKTKKQ